MEIGRVRRGTVASERKVTTGKKDFSQSFNQQRQKKSDIIIISNSPIIN